MTSPWITVTVPVSGIRELIDEAAAYVTAEEEEGHDGAAVLIWALAVLLGDSSGARNAIRSYLHNSVGSGEYTSDDMAQYIIRMSEFS